METPPFLQTAGDPLAIAVFASGTGSNFRTLLAHSEQGMLGRGCIVCLVSDRPDSGAVAHAVSRGLPTFTATHQELGGRKAFEEAALAFLASHGVRWIVLAGYMRLVGRTLLQAYEGHMINIHPSLLPHFPGLDAPAQALSAGVSETGVTVHYVDAGMDTGQIIAQTRVPILPNDSLAALTTRIHAAEHELLPRIVAQLCT